MGYHLYIFLAWVRIVLGLQSWNMSKTVVVYFQIIYYYLRIIILMITHGQNTSTKSFLIKRIRQHVDFYASWIEVHAILSWSWMEVVFLEEFRSTVTTWMACMMNSTFGLKTVRNFCDLTYHFIRPAAVPNILGMVNYS